MAPNSILRSQLSWSTWPWWGNLYPIREKCNEITIYCDTIIWTILANILLLRLVPRDCWFVVVLGQNEHCHGQSDAQRFRFCCFVHVVRARKSFLIGLLAMFWRFWRKGAPTLIWRNIACSFFFMNR
jgi:hypothetical protein